MAFSWTNGNLIQVLVERVNRALFDGQNPESLAGPLVGFNRSGSVELPTVLGPIEPAIFVKALGSLGDVNPSLYDLSSSK